MLDDLRGYLQLATGLSEVTAAKAKEAAMALVSHGLSLTTRAPDVVGQVQELADASYKANEASENVRAWVKSTCAVDIATGLNIEPPRTVPPATTTVPAAPVTTAAP